MMHMHSLKNSSRPRKKVQRVGRGPGSGRGKTSSRGHKGDGSRSGYKRRYGYEGGGVPLFQRLPTRGFTRGRFFREEVAINLDQLDEMYQDGEVVSIETLSVKGRAPKKRTVTLRILGQGELKKKVSIEAHYFSKSAIEKLKKQSISHKVLEPSEAAKTEK